MAIVRSFNPVWSFVDLTGNQADDTFYLYVLENQIPYIPALVYHDAAGTLPWNNPIQLLANGTLPVDVYWDDTQVYRLELRQNIGPLPPSQADPLIYLIENYIPGGEGSITPPVTSSAATDNQATNAQFSLVNFTGVYTRAATNPDPIEIAPGWFIDLTGTGTLEVERVPLNNAVTTPTNAPYALRIETGGGWTSAVLRQRLQQNGMLWAGKNVAAAFTARIIGASQNITARLIASNGATQAILINAALTNNFVEYTGFATLPAATNPDLPPAAYLDYVISLPLAGEIYITSFQLAQTTNLGAVPYQQDTVDRQIDHTFHYYKDQLIEKPIPSYLIGWDFPLNPGQIGTTFGAQALGAINKSFAAWDQTLIFQSVDNGVTVARTAAGSLQLTAAIAGQMAIVQYVDATIARQILQGESSVALRMACSAAQQTVTVGLYSTTDPNLPSAASPTFNSIVATLGADGEVATFNGNWVPLIQNVPANNELTITPTATEFMIPRWIDNPATPHAATSTFFAIVIGVNAMTLNSTITFDWVSLSAGAMATRPAPKSISETLLDCQRYYWKTFLPATVPAQNVGVDTGNLKWQIFSAGATSNGHNVLFPTPLRATPTITLYNPAAANALIRNLSTGLDCTSATDNITTKTVDVVSTNAGAGAALGNFIGVHVTADARLGIVN